MRSIDRAHSRVARWRWRRESPCPAPLRPRSSCQQVALASDSIRAHARESRALCVFVCETTDVRAAVQVGSPVVGAGRSRRRRQGPTGSARAVDGHRRRARSSAWTTQPANAKPTYATPTTYACMHACLTAYVPAVGRDDTT